MTRARAVTPQKTFRPVRIGFRQLAARRLGRSSRLAAQLTVMVVALAGMAYAFARGNALLVLLGLALAVVVAGAAFGGLYLYIVTARLAIVGDELVREGFPFRRRSAPIVLLKRFDRCTVDWGYGAMQPVWFATDVTGRARFWLDADLWPEAVVRALAEAVSADLEGSWETTVAATDLATRFPGRREYW